MLDNNSAIEHRPLVSIGMPVYNGKNYIRRALDSLIVQSYYNFELIISDNASDDGTWEVLQEYAEKNKKINLHRQEYNIGALNNFSFVLSKAKGKYFMWAAADDFWLPDFVTTMVKELETHPEASVSMCAVARFREDGTIYDIVQHNGSADPRRMSFLGMALALAAGRLYHLYIYGLYRSNFLRKAIHNFPSDVIAGDRIFICQVALATRFCYVDQVLHKRQISDLPLAIRYQHEEIGKMWQSPLAGLKMIFAVLPYLVCSRIIPLYRKLWIPLVTLRFGITFVYNTIVTLVYVISGRVLGVHGRQKVGKIVRGILGK